MRPIDGPELLEGVEEASWETVDCAADCEAFEVTEVRVVGVDAVLLFAVDAAGLAGGVVRAGDAAGKLGKAVGSVMSLLDRNVATMPPMLFRKLPICLRS
jgi:hypothetical protein